MTEEIAALLAQQRLLQANIDRAHARSKAQAIETVRALIEEHNISIRELGIRKNPLKGRKVPPKYFGPNGKSWSGRGKMPTWVKALQSNGSEQNHASSL